VSRHSSREIMPRRFLALCILLLSCHTHGNEMFSTPPTRYEIAGQDTYGHDAYEIHAVLQNTEKHAKLVKLTIRIYDESFDVPEEVLTDVYDPDFGKVSVVNDAGILGSFFSIDVPFAETGRCRHAKREGLTKSIYISSLGSGISAEIYDPCK
jgi:hypothetical protein